jgi:2-polyprenyl-6-hydroxyphenyl methylase/3-demethylubiquinone-9 3-methyltransferase
MSTANITTAERGSSERFEFGENWARFLQVLDDDRILEAQRSLREMLEVQDLTGRSFLDIGCGSGLLSLAAVRLGAARVHSLDVDSTSVACAATLRQRYTSDSAAWTIEQASALDADHLRELGRWDIVYSWGVLHHTGGMWEALSNVVDLVEPGGRLFISIYNDQELKSRLWRVVKRTFNRLPESLRVPYAVLVMLPREALSLSVHTMLLRPLTYVRSWTRYKQSRGMSRWHDIIDWVGGYPFEVAKPEEIFEFFHERGFTLERLVTRQGMGCNEFVFTRART